MGSIRARGWCFTYQVDISNIIHPTWDEMSMRYLVYQLEQAPTTGQYHWQGYVEFRSLKSMEAVKRHLQLRGVHLEVRRGTPTEAATYCKKEESRAQHPDAGPHEFGEIPPGQGHRSDLDSVVNMVKEGKSVEEVATTAPREYIKYHRGIEALMTQYNKKRRTEKPKVVWYWGDSGVGKTRRAYEEAGENVYVKDPSNKWWDGYENEKNVIIDDFKGFGGLSFNFMLRLMDRYSLGPAEKKGGHVNLNGIENIWITSIQPPQHYVPLGEPAQQLLRRLDSVEEIVIERSWPPTPIQAEDGAGPSIEVNWESFFNELNNSSYFDTPV